MQRAGDAILDGSSEKDSGTVLKILYVQSHLILTHLCQVDTFISPILQI